MIELARREFLTTQLWSCILLKDITATFVTWAPHPFFRVEHFNDDIDALNIRYLICNEEIHLPPAVPIYPIAANEQAFLSRLTAERAEYCKWRCSLENTTANLMARVAVSQRLVICLAASVTALPR